MDGGRITNRPFALSGGFPDRVRVRLNYVSNVLHSTSIGTTQVYSGNGLFDPDITGTGGQPYNYDDWSAQYTRYYCRGSTCKAFIVNNGTSAATGTQIFLVNPRHTTTSIATTGVYDAMAVPYAKWFISGSGGVATSNRNTLVNTMTSAKMFGHRPSEYQANESLTSANPAHQWYWHVSTHSADDSSFDAARIIVIITYDVEFFDRVDATLDMKLARIQEMREARAAYLKEKSLLQEDKKSASEDLDGWSFQDYKSAKSELKNELTEKEPGSVKSEAVRELRNVGAQNRAVIGTPSTPANTPKSRSCK